MFQFRYYPIMSKYGTTLEIHSGIFGHLIHAFLGKRALERTIQRRLTMTNVVQTVGIAMRLGIDSIIVGHKVELIMLRNTTIRGFEGALNGNITWRLGRVPVVKMSAHFISTQV